MEGLVSIHDDAEVPCPEFGVQGNLSPEDVSTSWTEAFPEDLKAVHVVLLGDSTLDNGRYLNIEFGELSVERQLSRRCADKGWDCTVLAQDGSMIDDVYQRQVPSIPSKATHLVLSASGNDLLALLNQMVNANFSASSMYSAIVKGLAEVSDRYRRLMKALQATGCHVACCTVYQPHFSHIFFKSLASFSLGLHNNRLKQISVDVGASVIDLANMFDSKKDFANPLELSTLGGAKVIETVTDFVTEHPPAHMFQHRRKLAAKEDECALMPSETSFLGTPLRCCTTRVAQRRIYCVKEVSMKILERDREFACAPFGRPLKFSEEQNHWRNAE
eukprot:TRINITY_DN30675_c0_g1_i1.p1 TRINITY_DN30675_c0_g1~~TRINITY_DN30675_c0_g1_i1.p1  ORF type:complete len:350 (+),score=55.11 TRINITY_DN30675_c0_g1_i1:58-1050(+)